jgi:hypothetical protein
LAGQILDTYYVVHPQGLSQPLEAFRGEFSWLAGFQSVTVNAFLVVLSPLCGETLSAAFSVEHHV